MCTYVVVQYMTCVVPGHADNNDYDYYPLDGRLIEDDMYIMAAVGQEDENRAESSAGVTPHPTDDVRQNFAEVWLWSTPDLFTPTG